MIGGRREAAILDAVTGILDTIQKGLVILQNLDPFQDIDPVDTFSEIPESPLLFPEASNGDVNERYYSDSDDEYVLDEERNVLKLMKLLLI